MSTYNKILIQNLCTTNINLAYLPRIIHTYKICVMCLYTTTQHTHAYYVSTLYIQSRNVGAVYSNNFRHIHCMKSKYII